MVRKHAVRLALILLSIIFASSALAQDTKKEMKKDAKPTIVNSVKKDVKKPTKPVTMKYVSCPQSGCGFWAKSHSKKELQSITKKHTKSHHKIELTDKQLKEMVKVEGTK